jgi:hypothetical protein
MVVVFVGGALVLLYAIQNADNLPSWVGEYTQKIIALINGGQING